MVSKEFLKNRARFPAERLYDHAGKWVAFAQDGTSIVAGATTLHLLEEKLNQLGVDAQNVCFEFVPEPGDEVFVSPESPGWSSPIRACS
jgi:hypothetical protein